MGPSNERDETVRTPSPVLSPTSTLAENSASPPVRHRPTFARLVSVLDESEPKYKVLSKEEDITETPAHRETDSPAGLGIKFAPDIHSWENSPGSTLADTLSPYDPGAAHKADTPYWSSPGQGKRSVSSFQSSLQHGFASSPDTQPLHARRSFTDTLRKAYEGFAPHDNCPSHEKANRSRFDSTAIVILILSVYSTMFSCMFLIIAAFGPRYGKHIGTKGSLTSANANLLAALIAKTIEISFATVFVAFLGQVLWRRASVRSQRRGVTLAEMEMRSWVMQPGTILTRFVAIRSSILTLLGMLSLTAAVMAMLYTTASEALVQPQLRFGHWEYRSMQGVVRSSWGNAQYLEQQCQSPTVAVDPTSPLDGMETCIEMEYAAQAYHNFQRFISGWFVDAANGSMSSELSQRPQGFALMTENTTVNAQWIELGTANGAAEVGGRIINNVSMAMPHAGVTSAARDSVNGILQPEDLDGLGVYTLHASVPSPVINVLCANMEASELKPIVYDLWTDRDFNSATWLSQQVGTVGPSLINNSTVVDDIFSWGPKYGHAPPVFGKLPIALNTVLNDTGPYGRSAIYVLGASSTDSYVLCSIKAYLTPSCSSRYNVSASGATLEAHCEDATDHMQYSHTNSTSGNITTNKDWVDAAQDWSTSLSLSDGLNDANASTARLLTQLILPSATLSPELPSPAEALAVLAGCTLLMGTLDTPFVPDFNYSAPSNILLSPEYQFFNATLRAQEYASGGSRGYQHGFYIVLIAVFLLNVGVLVYLVAKKGMVTDFSEPVNLFSLAVNSPPSEVMVGSCGGGPRGEQFSVPWFVREQGLHLFIEQGAGGEDEGSGSGSGVRLEALRPVGRAFERVGRRTTGLWT